MYFSRQGGRSLSLYNTNQAYPLGEGEGKDIQAYKAEVVEEYVNSVNFFELQLNDDRTPTFIKWMTLIAK